jgi:cytoskeleton protein RodZ
MAPQGEASLADAVSLPAADVGVPAALPASESGSAPVNAADAAQTGGSLVVAGPALNPALPASAAIPAENSMPDSALRLRASAPSWVEVRDASSRVVLARLVNVGEEVALDAPPPLRVKIGNARGTQLTFRGQVIDLVAAGGRDNVARLELK